MELYGFVLLAAAVLVASADLCAASKESHLTAADALTHALQNETPTKRFLRVSTTNKDDYGEQRGISVEKISNVLKSSKTKELEALLKADDTITNAFKKLKLSTMPVAQNNFVKTEMVVKLFSSRNFKVWAKHAAQINKQDPEGAMVNALRKEFDDKTLANMILVGKLSWKSKSTAKKMEKALFNAWYSEGKRPDGVLADILMVKFHDIRRSPRAMAIWADYTDYFKKRVLDYGRGK
ncbi:hypothetical protein PHYSODRAFT_288847 [Phytophthora sojae]|uniref:RxLR effector protein n=2 Tax=Phytophthora sojae TaxID=67593 RepID=G5A920_PHYSP|nr:hypothetical protein PHYSODRAFT_288847 [Phytophthora sojae]AEK80827.1 Avh174 [Phytophthora sojae]AEK80828.1 Avh174 [Phytophthora sojae]AEK80829.1 Avh174 [Phytophthora sojae]EGZ08396.1 hypothetical protein PHYSODRAFT_288847 [Phytophthora sojae]|eukprot:XP_009536568.1 hypothetical protein PHYSODRAFT_288847 [Phytophthora sojae]